MAKCSYCNQEMLKANGCTYSYVIINGKKYKRIKVGEVGDFYEGKPSETRCGECGAKVGYYHHPDCDLEISPLDSEQLFLNCTEYVK